MHRPRVPGDRDGLRPVVGEQLEEHVREAEQRARRHAVGGRELLGQREEGAVGEVVAVDEEEVGVARGRVVELELLPGQRLRTTLGDRCYPGPRRRAVTRIPLLSGTRIVGRRRAGRRDVVLRPPPPTDASRSVGAATREALRFPLAGEPLASLVTPGGTATVVIELPHLPMPSASPDPRQEAIAATVDELERLGVAHVTILVASGLGRRPSPREIGLLVPPEFRRRFRGPPDRPRRRERGARRARNAAGAAAPPLRRARRDRPRRHASPRRRPCSTAAPRRCCGPARARCCAPRARPRCSRPPPRSGWALAVELERRLAERAPLSRRLARPQPPARLRRLPVRGADPRADRALEAPARPRPAARGESAAA